jgi:membrane protein required for colicin V production
MIAADVVVLAILGVACLRGLLLGLIREVFSVASLAAAVVAVRLFVVPGGDWIQGMSDGLMGLVAARVLAGIAIVLVVIALGATAGRIFKRGARAVGLGWVDRAGGGLLGAAEGALVAGVLLAVVGSFTGRDHPLLENSRSMAALERLEEIAKGAGA